MECLARELLEEFELEAPVGLFVASSVHVYPDRKIELFAFEAELPSDPTTLNSHDEVQWVSVAALLSYQLAPADIPIAEKLIASAAAQPAAAKNRS